MTTPETTWHYYDANNNLLGYVKRIDTISGKSFCPFFVPDNNGGFTKGQKEKPWHLFGLNTLKDSKTIFVVEGEKCAACLHQLNIACVTSPNGSSSAKNADWTPLKNATYIYLLPDNDEPGEKYIKTVAEILLAQNPSVSLFRVPFVVEMDKGEDVADWIKANSNGGNLREMFLAYCQEHKKKYEITPASFAASFYEKKTGGDKERIKEALTFDAVFQHFGVDTSQKKEKGNGFVTISSPFNSDTSPSFDYHPIEKHYHCFSSGKEGDIFRLIALLAKLDPEKDFGKVLKIASDLSGVPLTKEKGKVIKMARYKPLDSGKFAEIISTIPREVKGFELHKQLEPLLQFIADTNGEMDSLALDTIRTEFDLKWNEANDIKKTIKRLRGEKNEGVAKQEDEFKPDTYYDLFKEQGIKHDFLSKSPVRVIDAVQEKTTISIDLPYNIRPRRLEYIRTKTEIEHLESLALERSDMDYRHVKRMLSRYLKEVCPPEILIPEVKPHAFSKIEDTALWQVIQSFDIPTQEEAPIGVFTPQEVWEIFNYCLGAAHLRRVNRSIRPMTPVIVSMTENIGKDTAIETMTAHWHPYVRKISFGKGTQEKEIQKAFSSALVVHVEEFERIGQMNAAFIRNLLTAQYGDPTLKGDNDPTRLDYYGVTFGSANSVDFMQAGAAQNSRIIPIYIDGINFEAYKPSLELSAQIYAQTQKLAHEKWGLSKELLEKIRGKQKTIKPVSEAMDFYEIFCDVASQHLPESILERGVVTKEERDSYFLFDKIRDSNTGLKNRDDLEMLKLLRQAGAVNRFKRYRINGEIKYGIMLDTHLDSPLYDNKKTENQLETGYLDTDNIRI